MSGTALAPLSDALQERFAKYVEQDAAAVTGGAGWSYFSTKGGFFRFQEEALESPLRVIILGAVAENMYFDSDFDPDDIQAPVCYAIGKVGGGSLELAPPDDLETRQHDACEGCPQNAFGSAERGRGKACGNRIRIAMLPADDIEPRVLAEREGARMRIPPTSLKAFNKYTRLLTAGYKRPLFSVITHIHIEQDPKTQFAIRFEPESRIDDIALLDILEKRVQEASEVLEEQPPRQAPRAEESRGRKPASRAAPRRAARTEEREPAPLPPAKSTTGKSKPTPRSRPAAEQPPAAPSKASSFGGGASKGKPTPRAKAKY